MTKMRIIWLSNKVQSDRDRGGTGSWLDAMAQGLIQSGEVELGNIAQGGVAKVTRQDCGEICQWIVPSVAKPRRRGGLPKGRFITEIVKAVEDFSPDLVQVWGTEGFWGLLTARELIRQTAILEIQGLKGAIARVFYGGLNFREQLACIGLKEILRQSTIFQGRKQFQDWGIREEEIISGHRFIITQSAWLEAQVKAINSRCQLFHNEFPLMEEFHMAEPWQPQAVAVILCSASYPSAFKGLHVAIRTVAILKNRFPNIQLRIAGVNQKHGIRQDGYVAWLNREAKRLGVETNLFWLGHIPTIDLVCELQKCSVFILPTFVEGYCLALAEAMMLGVPTVVSFTGGTSFLAKDENSALFFPAGDEAMGAYQLERLLTDRFLAKRLSCRAREVALVRNDRERIIKRQLEIYRQVIAESKNNRGPITCISKEGT